VEPYADWGTFMDKPTCCIGFGEGVPWEIPGRLGWPAPAAMNAAWAWACAAAAAATATAAAGADATVDVGWGDVAGVETVLLVSPLEFVDDEIPVALEWLICVLNDWLVGKDEGENDDVTDEEAIVEVEEEESAGGRGGCRAGTPWRSVFWTDIWCGAAEEANKALCISIRISLIFDPPLPMMEPIRSFGMGTSSAVVWGDAVGASVLGKGIGAMAGIQP